MIVASIRFEDVPRCWTGREKVFPPWCWNLALFISDLALCHLAALKAETSRCHAIIVPNGEGAGNTLFKNWLGDRWSFWRGSVYTILLRVLNYKIIGIGSVAFRRNFDRPGDLTAEPLIRKIGVPFCWTAKWVRTTPTDFPVVSGQSFLQKIPKNTFSVLCLLVPGAVTRK